MRNELKIEDSQIQLFGLGFLAVNLEQAAGILMDAARGKAKALVVTPNVDHIVQLYKNEEFRSIYRTARYVFVDGMPIVWFSHLLPKSFHLPARVNGTNLMMLTCEHASRTDLSVALVGGPEGAAEDATAELQAKYPSLKVAGYYCPPFGFENNQDENQKIVDIVQDWAPDFLFVGVGTPKQERWITENWETLNFHVAMGIGSAIELIAGQTSRAPSWWQNSGLEWLWRLGQEPGRLWKRYLYDDLLFLKIAWIEYWRIRASRD
jgi:N-acetylglucosaminyldiphosphoundecaprenol N-acetyl-beta-D-mannosaminyltransferase